MARKDNPAAEHARTAGSGEFSTFLYDAREEVLDALLENPLFDENHLCLLLQRKDLTGALLETIAGRKQWQRSYRVKRGVVFHPHTPRLLAMRLARELYLMDLVQLSLLPSALSELRRLANDLLLARLPQLPLGQKLALARRGSARVAGALLAAGHEQVVRVALDNAFLTEAQVLKVLSGEKLPAPVVAAIARHPNWSQLYHVRIALVRHPQTPLAPVLSFLPDLTQRDLDELCHHATLSESLRQYVRHEIARRAGAAGRSATLGPRRRAL